MFVVIICIILTILSSYYIFSGLLMMIMSLKTIKEIKKANHDKIVLKNNYYIVLPVLKEQRIDELKLGDKIILLKAPKTFDGKVGQMNYAYQQICLEYEKGYIGVYDIDSRPPQNIFWSIEQLIEKKKIKADIFQQVSSYCSGVEELKGISGDFAIADALSQTRWAMGFEYPLYKAYYKTIQNNTLRPLIYCIGHGCFVNIELSLGYLTSTIKGTVYPIPLLDFCQISRTALNSIKQYKFWFTGSSRFYLDIKYYISKYNPNISKKQQLLFKIQGGIRNFLWAWRSNLIILNLLGSLLLNSNVNIVLSIFSILIYVTIPYYLTYLELKQINEIKLKKRVFIFAPIITILNFVIRGIGPCIAMLTNSKKNNNIEYKTER